MAVQVPRLKQISPSSATPKNDRINLNVRDSVSSIQGRADQLGGVVDKVGDIYNDIEDETINTAVSEDNLEYNNWKNVELQKLKSKPGDPSKNYAEFDEAETQFLETMRSKRTDLGSRAKRHVDRGLNNTVAKSRKQVLKQRAAHQESYDTDLHNANIKLTKNSMPASATSIQVNDKGVADPLSFGDFDTDLNDIRTLVAKRGIKNGTVRKLDKDAKTYSHKYLDGDGQVVKVEYSPIAKVKAGKDLSEGVAASINALMVDDPEKAQAVFDRYEGYIDPKDLPGIKKRFKKVEDEGKAVDLLNDNKGELSSNQLNKLKSTDIETYQEVLKIQSTNSNRIKSLRKNREDNNYAVATQAVNEMRKNGTLYGDKSIEDNKAIQAVWPNLSENQKSALMEEVAIPKVSDDKAAAEMNSLILGTHPTLDITKMTPSQFQEKFKGLSLSKRKKSDSAYLRLNKSSKGGAGAAGSRVVVKNATVTLKRKLIANGFIKTDRSGKLNKTSLKRMNAAEDAIIDYFDAQDISKASDPKEINDAINEFVKSQKLLTLFGRNANDDSSGGIFSGLSGLIFGDDDEDPVKTPKTTSTQGNPLEGLTKPEVFKFQRDFKKQFKGPFPEEGSPNYNEFLNYVKGRTNG